MSSIDVERYGPYRGLDEIRAAADQIRADHPEIVRRVEYGRSVRGEPLEAFELARPGEPPRVPCLYIAAVHAMEWIGVESLIAVMQRAAVDVAEGRLAGRAITFVPVVNPDGYRHVEEDLRRGSRRFTRRNANKVDLNRNFEIHFSRRPSLLGPVFAAGEHPFSEPETRALRDLAAACRPQRVVSLHAFGGYFLYPYTGSRRPPPDLHLYEEIGEQMRALQPRYPYRLLRVGALPRPLWARGSEIDYFRDRFGALTFLIEVSRGGLELRDPLRVLDPFCWFNPRDVASEVLNVLPAALHVAAVEI